MARQCRRYGVAVAHHARRRLEQVVPEAIPVGCRQDRYAGRDQGPGGPPEAFAVRPLPLVPPATRWPHHGWPDVRRGHVNDSARTNGIVAPAIRAYPRLVHYVDGLLRLSAAR